MSPQRPWPVDHDGYSYPPSYEIASSIQTDRPHPTATTRQATDLQSKPLPPLRTENLDAAYIPHCQQRLQPRQLTLGQHSATGPMRSYQLPSRDTLHASPGLLLQTPQILQTGLPAYNHPDVDNPPANLWLPSPQTPGTHHARRSGLQSFERLSTEKQRRKNYADSPIMTRVRTWVVTYFVEWWMLEILSWGLSAAIMTTIITLLAHFDKGAIPTLRYNLTLNQLVSALSGLARAALLLPTAEALGQLKWNSFRREPRIMLDFERLDMASRGPWGALVLVLRFRHLSWASVGAAIVVLALSMDWFFQLIVQYPTNLVPISLAQTPSATFYKPSDTSTHIGGAPAFRPLVDFAALAESMYLTNASMPELKANCPSSNCTWPAFDTLGVCSSCTDVSSRLTQGCFDVPFDWTLAGLNKVNASGPITTQCGYFLDIGTGTKVLMSGYTKANGTVGLALGMRFLPAYDTFSRRAKGNGSQNFPEIRNPLHNMFISATPDGPEGAFRNVAPLVSECVMYWCVKTISTAYYAGRFTENVTATYIMNTTQENPWQDYNTTLDQPAAYIANFTLELPDRHNPLLSKTFFVDNVTTVDAIQVFDPLSPSYVTGAQPGAIPQLRWINNLQRTPPWMQPLPNKQNLWLPPTNISVQLDLMAKAMTYILRNAPPETNGLQTIEGIAWAWRTTVKIRWEFLSLPLTLLGTSLVFLVATIVRSSIDKEHIGVWKTSALAVLFNGVGDEIQSSVGPNCRMSEARTKAKTLMVKLVPD